jgi:hypothetical protein
MANRIVKGMAMIAITKQTRLTPENVMDKASAFFGKGGEGLEENERTSCRPCRIIFEGAGGYVAISISDEVKHRIVDIEAREFEYQAKQFLGKL